MGIDEITSTVAGRAENEILEFKIARGTQVMSEHESALVDLCASIGVDEQEIEDCVVNYLSSVYDEIEDGEFQSEEIEDEDTLLQNTFQNLWGDELREVSPLPLEQNGE